MLGRDYAVLLVFAGENEGCEPCGAELLQLGTAAAPVGSCQGILRVCDTKGNPALMKQCNILRARRITVVLHGELA